MNLLRSLIRQNTISLEQYAEYFNYLGSQYGVVPSGGTLGGKEEAPSATFGGYVRAGYKQNGIVFACMLARLMLFSEARFQWRQLRSGRPGDLFGGKELEILERPWKNGTTGDLLKRMIQDGDLSGNFYAARRNRELRRMRPDWTTIVLGSNQPADTPQAELDAEVIGYVYEPGGPARSKGTISLLPEEVCHFAPIPDPEAQFRGMSWLTPIIREMLADQTMTNQKLAYFENGMTPNMVVVFPETHPASRTADAFKKYVAAILERHRGSDKAFETLFLAGGAQATSVGNDLKEVDFKAVQGAGETRIAAAAGVPPIVVGLSEGLQGSSLNAGNFGMAMRRFSDLTMSPLWRDAAASLQALVTPPDRSSELWYDARDIPALREDAKDGSEVQRAEAQTIAALIKEGFTPDSVVDAVKAGDWARLKHTGLVSVQLQPPGVEQPDPSANGKGDPVQIDALG